MNLPFSQKGNPLTRLSLLAVTGITCLVMVGCSKDDNTTGTTLTAEEQLNEGWVAFEDGDYSTALSSFQSAYVRSPGLADAWNGAGWALGKLPSRIDESIEKFQRALSEDTTRYDAYAGWAFAAFNAGSYQLAIDKVNDLLHRRPVWRFLHQQSLDRDDLRLLQAAAYYQLADYSSALNVVVTYFDPLFEADPTTPAGRRAIFDEIETLRRLNG